MQRARARHGYDLELATKGSGLVTSRLRALWFEFATSGVVSDWTVAGVNYTAMRFLPNGTTQGKKRMADIEMPILEAQQFWPRILVVKLMVCVVEQIDSFLILTFIVDQTLSYDDPCRS